MENYSELLILIGSLGGTLIGFLSSIVITHLNNKSAEQKLYKQLAFTAGIEDWKTRIEILRASKRRGKGPPIHHGILYMLKISEILTKKKITHSEVSQILEDAALINKTVSDHIDKREKTESP